MYHGEQSKLDALARVHTTCIVAPEILDRLFEAFDLMGQPSFVAQIFWWSDRSKNLQLERALRSRPRVSAMFNRCSFDLGTIQEPEMTKAKEAITEERRIRSFIVSSPSIMAVLCCVFLATAVTLLGTRSTALTVECHMHNGASRKASAVWSRETD